MKHYTSCFLTFSHVIPSFEWTGIDQSLRRLTMDWMTERSRSPGRVKNFVSTASRPLLVPTQPTIQWAPGAVSPGVKRLGSEADHSPPTSAEVKNGGAIPSLPHTSSWRSA
jgi:hypothetical protein